MRVSCLVRNLRLLALLFVWKGQVFLAANKFLGFLSSVNLAEGFVIKEGLWLARDMSFFPFIIKIDSLRLLRLLSSSAEDLSELGVLASNLKQFLMPQFCSVYFTPRSGNSVANSLARLAMVSHLNRVLL